jgi:hypothetical protein
LSFEAVSETIFFILKDLNYILLINHNQKTKAGVANEAAGAARVLL